MRPLPGVAFENERVVAYAEERLRNKLEYTNVAYSLLPRRFTLTQLQRVYEAILGEPQDKPWYRRSALWVGLITLVLLGAAGVGVVVADLVARALPTQFPFVAVAAYCVGMALFTMCMGNAFAAFPVMTAGVALPILIGKFGGDPAVVASIGMLSGFCGTLMTPLAANSRSPPMAP